MVLPQRSSLACDLLVLAMHMSRNSWQQQLQQQQQQRCQDRYSSVLVFSSETSHAAGKGGSLL